METNIYWIYWTPIYKILKCNIHDIIVKFPKEL